jgi:hypothetical protein
VKASRNSAAIASASGTQIDEFHALRPPQPPGIRAVTSISIFIRGSCKPATIIVAAGRASPSHARVTGQQAAQSPPSGRM